MRLTLLGTGTPWPSTTRQSTANLVSIGDQHILFDAGRGVTTQLARLGMHPRDVDHIFLTHHHFDHICGLDDLLLSAWNDGRTKPVTIHGPVGTRLLVQTLFQVIYQRDIRFRLLEAEIVNRPMPHIAEVFSACDLDSGASVETPFFKVSCRAVEHGHAMGLTHDEWPCFGYRLETGAKVLAISGDTIDCTAVRTLATGADVLVQCCYLPEAAVDSAERRMIVDSVLGSATQAGRIARAAGVRRMVLTHLAPGADAMQDALLAEAQDGFAGEVIIGHDLMQIEV